jgi:hypothetical protein
MEGHVVIHSHYNFKFPRLVSQFDRTDRPPSYLYKVFMLFYHRFTRVRCLIIHGGGIFDKIAGALALISLKFENNTMKHYY